MLTSISATERIRLWDRFSGPVDQDAVKLEFFRKIHSKNPPFRIKVKLAPKNRVKVPLMVKCHYQKPVKLLPSLRDVLRLESVLNRDNLETMKVEDKLCENVSLPNGSEKQTCDINLENTQKEECCLENEEFVHKNGCIKNEIMNGNAENSSFLPDVVSDISSEGG